LVNGYGCAVDFEHALKVLRRAAKLGSVPARVNLYRIHAALGREEVSGEDLTVHLEWYACLGSIAALVDHASLALQEPKNMKRSVAHASGGFGAWWAHENQMLHGLTQADWGRDGFLLSQAETLPNVTEYKINMRGDTLAHFAAACGEYKSLKALIGRFGFDVNCRNDAGDTPLICASRSGQGGTMILLVQDFGADPSLAANNGETALHWLISFNDATVPAVARDLLARGADLEAMTNKLVAHHAVPWIADVERLMPGTAIAWAACRNRPEIVRVLLDAGALVYYDNDFNKAGPLNWAAQFHHTQCLKLMIDALECRHKKAANETGGTVATIMYSSPLYLATHSADAFSMILRNGTGYLQDMTETLDLLRHKSTGMRSMPKFGGSNQTLFYLAVAEAHDEVVRYMLRHRWHVEDLDRPCGESLRTPVLEAVRWGRMSIVNLLIEHGADIHARGANPYKLKQKNWSALHVLATEGHEEGGMVENIISHGLDVDGQELLLPAPVEEEGRSEVVGSHPRNDSDDASEYLVETPLSCALRSNAFSLCDTLITCGADPYATCTSAGLYSVSTPITILGHLIISNSLYSLPRLRYLFRQELSTLTSAKTLLFNVQPSLELSALHLAALVPSGVRTTDGTIVMTSDFDFDTNREILHGLLSHFKAPECLDARCLPDGNTALMIAVQEKNLGAVEELLIAGADRKITNSEGKTALDLVVEQMGAGGQEEEQGWEAVLELFVI
jgi:ankyrin repeat protein